MACDRGLTSVSCETVRKEVTHPLTWKHEDRVGSGLEKRSPSLGHGVGQRGLVDNTSYVRRAVKVRCFPCELKASCGNGEGSRYRS